MVISQTSNNIGATTSHEFDDESIYIHKRFTIE